MTRESSGTDRLPLGYWEASLAVGPDFDEALRFGLETGVRGNRLAVRILNGPEAIVVPRVMRDGATLVLGFPHYDAEVRAALAAEGKLEGTYRKRRGPDEWAEVPFQAWFRGERSQLSEGERERLEAFGGSWTVQFATDDDPALAIVHTAKRHPWGTVRTTTGDYRYLAARAPKDGVWELSCFDGAHAFLIRVIAGEDFAHGDFWSGAHWHETLTARPVDEASMPDAFALTTWDAEIPLEELVFPDLRGEMRSLADPSFDGDVRLLHVFGSWCPNCHDAARYLAELKEQYEGLHVLGLAFELTGDFARDAEQVRHYLERHDSDMPVLIVGLADKEKATERFRALDRIRSYPTTIFLDRHGAVRAVHTGFNGPATGDAHQELRRRFEATIESILADAPRSF